MRMLILYKIILPCSLFFVMLSAAQAQTSVLKIQMDNFKEDGKKVWVALYQNEATFLGPNIFIGTSVIVKIFFSRKDFNRQFVFRRWQWASGERCKSTGWVVGIVEV